MVAGGGGGASGYRFYPRTGGNASNFGGDGSGGNGFKNIATDDILSAGGGGVIADGESTLRRSTIITREALGGHAFTRGGAGGRGWTWPCITPAALAVVAEAARLWRRRRRLSGGNGGGGGGSAGIGEHELRRRPDDRNRNVLGNGSVAFRLFALGIDAITIFNLLEICENVRSTRPKVPKQIWENRCPSGGAGSSCVITLRGDTFCLLTFGDHARLCWRRRALPLGHRISRHSSFFNLLVGL